MSPKQQSTAQQRAREAAKDGAKYTRALRAEAGASNAPLPAPELLADPTPSSLRHRVRELMIRLDINQRAAVAQESLPWGAAASGQLEDTCRFLDRLAHELDRPRGEQRGYELRKWISNTERALETARQGTGGTAAFRLAADQLEVWRLSRALHAMAVGCCTEGAGSDDPCSPEPGRVIVAIHDPLGVLDSDQACARHAADHVLRWEDVMPYRLHGDHETAVATHILIRQARAEGPTPAG